MVTGKCQCGAIRYEAEGEPAYSALCHCADCRASAGAPMVGWALFPEDKVSISGAPVQYRSSENATRHFCGVCGTGLFYTNPLVFPGSIDIQTATLDDPAALPPQAHVQMADALPWMAGTDALPKFDRYPGEYDS
ncbi:aldehyde-activating protein [Sphingobium lactosutens]|uniref:GFA family protein n=1 Tax=Sphingobium lactosutens TaxID=522773 RepID=UPI0015C1C394|nr:GFA family protein [Sphingobium lactosutens]NWK98643.1 aldehyde-activating protein [Sphingobium lactosutens]